jgi:hypothetical protein
MSSPPGSGFSFGGKRFLCSFELKNTASWEGHGLLDPPEYAAHDAKLQKFLILRAEHPLCTPGFYSMEQASVINTVDVELFGSQYFTMESKRVGTQARNQQ